MHNLQIFLWNSCNLTKIIPILSKNMIYANTNIHITKFFFILSRQVPLALLTARSSISKSKLLKLILCLLENIFTLNTEVIKMISKDCLFQPIFFSCYPMLLLDRKLSWHKYPFQFHWNYVCVCICKYISCMFILIQW